MPPRGQAPAATAKSGGETGAEQKQPDPTIQLRTDGPTLEEFLIAGYKAENYPPEGYAEKPSPALDTYRATGQRPPTAEPEPERTRRVICTLTVRHPRIDNVRFATFAVGDKSLHISDRMTDAQVARFESIPDAYAPATADAVNMSEADLDAAMDAAHTPKGGGVEGDLNTQISMLRLRLENTEKANLNIAGVLKGVRDELQAERDKNRVLSAELDALKAGGRR